MKNNTYRGKTESESGAIGIGAMIVFIALILVAAVASAVIIQTGEKLQQNAQQTGSDTQREIAGKIAVKKVVVEDSDEVFMYFESSPGSDVLDVRDIAWQVACTNRDPDGDGILDETSGAGSDNAGYQFIAGFFGDGDDTDDDSTNFAYPEEFMGPTDDNGDGTFGQVTGADTSREAMFINPGENYVIKMDLNAGGTNNGDDCGIDNQNINDEITLWIHIQGGGSTYETLTITDKTFGSDLV
jgi:archaellin